MSESMTGEQKLFADGFVAGIRHGNRNRELDEPNALVERIAQAVHDHILATEPQTTGASIVAVIRGFIREPL